jgi:hypothetical protein
LSDYSIYSEFSEGLKWIAKKHRLELESFPKSISPLAEHYLKNRLFILTEKPVKIDVRSGMPFPYLAYWFAKAFSLDDKIINKLASTLTYISLTVSIRDDLLDGTVQSAHGHVCLANLYYDKYFRIFKSIFPPNSIFWHILSNCLNEWSRYESWSYLFEYKNQIKPFSQAFLKESSRYLVAITLPTLAAIAIVTNNQTKIPQITKFLKNYWMGWKVVDDTKDWQSDLRMPNFNHSCILYYVSDKINRKNVLSKDSIFSAFLSTDFINLVYGTIQKFYRRARRDVLTFKSPYLTRFMDTQIVFYKEEREEIINTRSIFYDQLDKLIVK